MTLRRLRMFAAEVAGSLRRLFFASPAEGLVLAAAVALLFALSLAGLWRWHFA